MAVGEHEPGSAATELTPGEGAEAQLSRARSGSLDLYDLCDLFAGMFGGPVVVEDRDFQVIAYSRRGGPGDKYRRQTILDRQTPHEWIEGLVRNGLLKHLRTTSSPIRLEADALVPGAVPRLVSGVVHD